MMQPVVLDKNFESIKVLDSYTAFIWTERYCKYGDFEFHAPVSKELIDALQIGNYLYLSESDILMIIEAIEIKTDSSRGNTLKASGRSISSILSRRIVWKQTTINGYLEDEIFALLIDNLIDPEDSDRQIPNFLISYSGDPDIEAVRIRAQYTGDNLYEIIASICEHLGFGFEVWFDKETNDFVFGLYNGADRTYDQDVNEPVEFSPRFDNLIESDYIYDEKGYKTIALVAGQGEGEERKTTEVISDSATGLDRRELYVDARDIQQDEEMTDQEYEELLQERGKEKMTAYVGEKSFDASTETEHTYKYGVDFLLGDILYVQNEYGVGSKCRVTEVIRSMKSSGYYEYPTFELIED